MQKLMTDTKVVARGNKKQQIKDLKKVNYLGESFRLFCYNFYIIFLRDNIMFNYKMLDTL